MATDVVSSRAECAGGGHSPGLARLRAGSRNCKLHELLPDASAAASRFSRFRLKFSTNSQRCLGSYAYARIDAHPSPVGTNALSSREWLDLSMQPPTQPPGADLSVMCMPPTTSCSAAGSCSTAPFRMLLTCQLLDGPCRALQVSALTSRHL